MPAVDPLGLSLIHESSEPVVDFIFVHGLGGSSYRTWSWNHDPQYFWPIWLKDDMHLSQSRLFTFGYNADFTRNQTASNILDFAKDLLFRLKTYASVKSPENNSVGQVGLDHHARSRRLTWSFSIRSFLSCTRLEAWLLRWCEILTSRRSRVLNLYDRHISLVDRTYNTPASLVELLACCFLRRLTVDLVWLRP